MNEHDNGQNLTLQRPTTCALITAASRWARVVATAARTDWHVGAWRAWVDDRRSQHTHTNRRMKLSARRARHPLPYAASSAEI